KISIPPTLLVSVIGQTRDVARSLDLEPRAVGDRLYLLGPTARELAGSEFSRTRVGAGLGPESLGTVPQTDLALCWARYRAFAAQRDAGRLCSAHVCGRGGLALALAHMVLASERGLEIDLDGSLDAVSALFSESTGRIVLSCREDDAAALEDALGPHGLRALGRVVAPPRLTVTRVGAPVFDLELAALRGRFMEGLHGL
ncbi:MAG: hypothetical protein KC457_32345, partial [Myxococcales bacterium]|nr:hypothetical protein [Myxococcales bacterium]